MKKLLFLALIIFMAGFSGSNCGATEYYWDEEGSSAASKTVRDAQTIQSVIDSCPVAIGSLKEGFSNPYVVNVPPGHEKEYYSLVRNASDVASDKRNIRIILEDNPKNEFIIDQWDSLDEIGDWSTKYGVGTLTLDTAHHSEGISGFRAARTGGNVFMEKAGSFDFSGYSGLMLDIYADLNNIGFFYLYLYNGDEYTKQIYGFDSKGIYKGSVFLNFEDSTGSIPIIDRSAITRITFQFILGSSGNTEVYVDNIRLVRTTPHCSAILRFDDGLDEHWSIAAKHLDAKGFKGNFGIVSNGIVAQGPDSLGLDNCRKMNRNGHVLVNHTNTHPHFITDGLSSAEVYQEYTSCASWLEQNGYGIGKQIFINPYGQSCEDLENFLEQSGVASAYPTRGKVLTSKVIPVSSSCAIPSGAQDFIASKQGGVAQFMFHTITNEANFVTLLEWIRDNFSEVLTFPDMLKRLPAVYRPIASNLSSHKSGFSQTLSGSFSLKNHYGQSIILDPGGAARNIYPIKGFQPYHRVEIINIADANEVLTFEPTFSAAGAHDGAGNATALTDSGESWVSGQLVGKLLTNTTDGSNGTITDNNATRITAALANGTDNDFDIGDNCTIAPVGRNEAVGQNERGIFVYDGAGGWLKVYVGS